MNLRRSLPALLSPLLLFAPACARAQEPAAPAKAAALEKARPALWKVADEDTTIWLFGTIHILPAGIDWYSGPIAEALEGADTLVTEVADSGDPETAKKVARLALAQPPSNLREKLSPEERAKYEAALAELKLPAASFDANDPWYAAVALSTLPLMRDGFGTMNGAEAQLVALAKKQAKAHIGLETAEMQLGLFDSLPTATQVTYLNEVLENFPKIRSEIGAMVEAWKSGRADTLAALMNEDESDPALMKTLLTDRNKAWAKWIAQRLEQPGTVFVAVGAGHLSGKESVQAQLAAEQIRAKRVR